MMIMKFASLIDLKDDNTNINTMITTNNAAVADTTSETHRKERRWIKPEMFSTSVKQGNKQEGSEGNERN